MTGTDPSRQPVHRRALRLPTWRRNLYGSLLILAGIVMLFLPGQGILTILFGFLLLDFPGKRGLWRRMLAHPKIEPSLKKAHDFMKKSLSKPKNDLP